MDNLYGYGQKSQYIKSNLCNLNHYRVELAENRQNFNSRTLLKYAQVKLAFFGYNE